MQDPPTFLTLEGPRLPYSISLPVAAFEKNDPSEKLFIEYIDMSIITVVTASLVFGFFFF